MEHEEPTRLIIAVALNTRLRLDEVRRYMNFVLQDHAHEFEDVRVGRPTVFAGDVDEGEELENFHINDSLEAEYEPHNQDDYLGQRVALVARMGRINNVDGPLDILDFPLLPCPEPGTTPNYIGRNTGTYLPNREEVQAPATIDPADIPLPPADDAERRQPVEPKSLDFASVPEDSTENDSLSPRLVIQEPEKDADATLARDHFELPEKEKDEMFSSFDSSTNGRGNGSPKNSQPSRFSVYDQLTPKSKKEGLSSTPGSGQRGRALGEESPARRRLFLIDAFKGKKRDSSTSSESEEATPEMTFVYEGGSFSPTVAEPKPRPSCLKKQKKQSWSSDEDDELVKTEPPASPGRNCAMDTTPVTSQGCLFNQVRVDRSSDTPWDAVSSSANSPNLSKVESEPPSTTEMQLKSCLRKSVPREDGQSSDRSRKSSLSSRGEKDKPGPARPFKSSLSDRNNNRNRLSAFYHSGERGRHSSGSYLRHMNRDGRFRRDSRESNRDSDREVFRRKDDRTERSDSRQEFRTHENRNDSEREVRVYNNSGRNYGDRERTDDRPFSTLRRDDRNFGRFKGSRFESNRYQGTERRDDRDHSSFGERRGFSGGSMRRDFRGEHCTRSSRNSYSSDNFRRRRRDSDDR
ncbi:Oidioi.mRNA.OKI2018_I69.XSR.g15041.t1.cds [Oikopleura dioica]|uniref:Oidioi.mRNA.OKI2018_I69.XSR.g15041.t1.cds n=1 Tax=Oikopleura dioica TaxID=34765 RepID=A0ABN7SGR9_OIKDI|nr:Oidioi.mRNA.OKI2018_I69.XSR.g15041.t1.cds [Oikopleura dioica]